MKKFEDITTVTTGTFPDTKSVASSTPSTPDGTPYLKALLDETWGWMQAMLAKAGITPDGIVESAAVGSQVAQSIQKIAGYPGEMVPWMGSNFAASDPTALGIRLLPMEGQTILIADYVDLDAVCYVGNSANLTAPAFFRTSDAGGTSRNANGPYFNIPDMRGYFVRGYDPSGIIDPDSFNHVVGSIQDDILQTHEHICEPDDNPSEHVSLETLYPRSSGDKEHVARDLARRAPEVTALPDVMAAEIEPASVHGVETRPKNITVRWCIRY